jgi:hypothetical protein
MPRAPGYQTIGEFYEVLRGDLELACAELGERRLFTGPAGLQLTGKEIRSTDLVVVRGMSDARRAIALIVEQGEGSGEEHEDSHFGRFESIRDEFLALRSGRPEFQPARDAPRNPVMHEPVAQERTWIIGRQAAPVIDAANATYSAMLRCLVQLYDTPAVSGARRQALLGAALSCMKGIASLGSSLTELQAGDASSLRAGMSFAMLRAVEGPVPDTALQALSERLTDIAHRILELGLGNAAVTASATDLLTAAEALRKAR